MFDHRHPCKHLLCPHDLCPGAIWRISHNVCQWCLCPSIYLVHVYKLARYNHLESRYVVFAEGWLNNQNYSSIFPINILFDIRYICMTRIVCIFSLWSFNCNYLELRDLSITWFDAHLELANGFDLLVVVKSMNSNMLYLIPAFELKTQIWHRKKRINWIVYIDNR